MWSFLYALWLLQIGTIISTVESTQVEFIGQLPTAKGGLDVLWDGQDGFYLLGGYESTHWTKWRPDLFLFSKKSNTTKIVARFPPYDVDAVVYYGTAFFDVSSNIIHYLGGQYSTYCCSIPSRDTYTISPTAEGSGSEYGINRTAYYLNSSTTHGSSFWIKEEQMAYVIGRNGSWKYFPANQTMKEMQAGDMGLENTVATVHVGNGIFYIFAGNVTSPFAKYDDSIIRYDSNTGAKSTLQTKLKYPVYYGKAVWDGKYAYIVGGRGVNSSFVTGIQRFDPEIEEVDILDAQFPYLSSLSEFGIAFVPGDLGQNEIYVFGGEFHGGQLNQDILRIQIDKARGKFKV
jgi:hypothetical protein